VGNFLENAEEVRESVCDTLLMCIVTTLNQGLRNGGGIGDVLRSPSKEVSPPDLMLISFDVLILVELEQFT